MAFKQKIMGGSDIVTEGIWNGVQGDIASQFLVVEEIQNSTDTYVYDASYNLVSGNHTSTTGSWYESYKYDSNNFVISGLLLRDGYSTTMRYVYDANNNVGSIIKVVS